MELPSRYNPKESEDKWCQLWEDARLFHATPTPEKKPFTVVIPPPNVTGILHMGHALNNTLQDIIVRYKRMKGFEALWMPGTDHAGIATQNVVEKQLAKEGKTRQEVGREAFLKLLWDWQKQYGGTILHQLRKLGSSCDWDRTRFTMDEPYSDAVKLVFVKLFEKGLIYQGKYIINWCPRCQTALSDEEAEHKDVQGALYHIRYSLKDDPTRFVTVATTRPETMLGDTAVAVHPKDSRYKKIIGKTLVLPILNREIKIISDDFVDPKFGSGAVKVTPAHDPNDFLMGKRHALEFINIMHPDARLNENAGPYQGLDRFVARKKIVEALKESGQLEKIDTHAHAVGHCYRCHTVVEPYLSKQWFVKMKPLAQPAAEVVKKGKVKFYPKRWTKVYLNWMENIQDWCISRQIWWGHQIPVWHKRVKLTEENWTQELLRWGWDSYIEGNWKDENIVVRIIHAQTGEEVDPKKDPLMPVTAETEGEYDIYVCTTDEKLLKQFGFVGFKQDTDVLDTWFSSWLWPFATLNWPKETKDLNYFYPTAALFTASEIIFFWVARMIMAGIEFMGEAPFKDVYIHGTVRDSKGQKMSKSLGNALDPLEIINEYGADALRFSLIMNSGQDLFIAKDKFEIGRNFANKIWNATRLILKNAPEDLDFQTQFFRLKSKDLDLESRWIISRFQSTLAAVGRAIEQYRFSEAETLIYEFFWGNFCDWYLEMAKDKLTETTTQIVSLAILEQSLRMMHPFMPFVTEEIASKLPGNSGSLVRADWPKGVKKLIDKTCERDTQRLIDVVIAIRNLRKETNIGLAEHIEIVFIVDQSDQTFLEQYSSILCKMAKINKLNLARHSQDESQQKAKIIFAGALKFFIPMKLEDLAKEKERLQAQFQMKSAALERVNARLQNESFVQKAPAEVVQKDKLQQESLRKELQDLDQTIQNLNHLIQ